MEGRSDCEHRDKNKRQFRVRQHATLRMSPRGKTKQDDGGTRPKRFRSLRMLVRVSIMFRSSNTSARSNGWFSCVLNTLVSSRRQRLPRFSERFSSFPRNFRKFEHRTRESSQVDFHNLWSHHRRGCRHRHEIRYLKSSMPLTSAPLHLKQALIPHEYSTRGTVSNCVNILMTSTDGTRWKE